MVDIDFIIWLTESLIDEIDDISRYVYGSKYCSQYTLSRIYNDLQDLREKIVKLRELLTKLSKELNEKNVIVPQ